MVRRMIETGKGIRAENIVTVWTALPGSTSNCAGLIEMVLSVRARGNLLAAPLDLTVEIVLAWLPFAPLPVGVRPHAFVLMQPEPAFHRIIVRDILA